MKVPFFKLARDGKCPKYCYTHRIWLVGLWVQMLKKHLLGARHDLSALYIFNVCDLCSR